MFSIFSCSLIILKIYFSKKVYQAFCREEYCFLIDLTRNENNSNVESLYSTLENIKNGRLNSTFYGRFKRLRFKSPHLLIMFLICQLYRQIDLIY